MPTAWHPLVAKSTFPIGKLNIIRAGSPAGRRDAGVRPLPRRGLLKQAAEHDPGLVLGLHGLPESQPTAGQRIRADVDLDTE